MSIQEKDKISHLTILSCYTIFCLILVAESILLSWDMGAVMLLFGGMIACWILHITDRIPGEIRIWLYYILTMLSFFFYGIHETSMYDIAPVMILVMLLYSVTERTGFTQFCVLTYYVTMLYDIFVVCGGSIELTPLILSRLMLHFVVVTVAGYLIILILKRRGIDQKIAEEKILELEEINNRTEQFLTNVSHELRTPINVVTGVTAVMTKKETDPVKRKDIRSIQNAGRRLFQQIEDILDYTELDTGRIKVISDNYMISSLINDIISEERQKERDHNLEIVFDVEPSVPAMLYGDSRKIKKMIQHLLDNSIKYTQKGGVYVHISSSMKSYGINLCIEVKDTGIGVEEGKLDKIREKFYQLQNGKMRRAGGLGLGLSIVCGMTAAMEGFFQMKSIEGQGTYVHISIPQKVVDATPGMTIANRNEFCTACYLKPERYEVPAVRDYFNTAIAHLVQGLDLSVHRVVSREELECLVSIYRLTHLFIGQYEYEEDKEYFESLTEQMRVVVVAQETLSLPKDSGINLIRKPFYNLSIVNVLNANDTEETICEEGHILCPGLNVLVVDDEPMNLMVAEGILKEYQMDVTTAESGMGALDLCRKESFDLIFLDHMMPEMDGIETLKLLRKISIIPGKALTVIAFTANAVSGAREMFRQEGFDEFISKPIDEMELERVLKKVLPRSAYVYQEDSEEEANMLAIREDERRLRRLESVGIRTRVGINYCRGDVNFYYELLNKFVQDEAVKDARMKKALEKEDCDNYRIQVHGLKSTAKMIGAEELSGKAKEMEEASKNYQLAYIKEHHEALLENYRYVLAGIRKVLAGHSQEKEARETKTEIGKDEFLRQLKELHTGLETFEVDKAENVLARMSEEVYGGNSIGEMLLSIKQDVENFDFEECLMKVDSLVAKVEGGSLA